MKTILAAAVLFALGAGAVIAKTPPPPVPLDTQIIQACEKEGAKTAECACGLKIAKETMTDRQLALVPILYPIAKGKGDTMTKLSTGMAAARAHGYTDQEALQAVMAVANNSSRTEKECKQPS